MAETGQAEVGTAITDFPRPFSRLMRRSWWDEKFPYLTLAILVVFGLIQITWGERIPINDGLGWDGEIYASITKGFPENIFRKEFGAYHLQRMFPSAVVNLGMRVLGFERSTKNIIKAFQIYDLLMLLMSAIIWSLLTTDLGVSGRSKWLGFCFLFINFPILKFDFYYPVLTDATAFALGLWLAYCFLKRNSLGVLLLSVVGAFTWPTLLYSGILLYLFPNANSGSQHPIVPARYKLNVVVAIAVCALIVASIMYMHYGRHMLLPHGHDQINGSLIFISVLAVMVYILASLGRLFDLDDLFNLKAILNFLRGSKIVISATIFLMIKMIVAILKLDRMGDDGYMTTHLLAWTALDSVAKPAIFLVALAVYFGPVVLFFMYYFGSLCRIIHRHGIGLTLYFVLYLLLALDPESRHVIVAFPMAVILVTVFMDKLPWRVYHGWMIFAACLLFSKIWLPINNQGLTGSYLEFPFQYYFMNQGPYMSALSYVIQGIFVILTGGFLYFVLFRRVALSNERAPGESVVG